jgi:hypothetical protein
LFANKGATQGRKLVSDASALLSRPWAKRRESLTAVKVNQADSDEAIAAQKASRDAILSEIPLLVAHGARFSTEIYTRGCHWFPRLLASA